MSDSLLEDRLTTADIANPPTPRQARAAAMDRNIEPADMRRPSRCQPPLKSTLDPPSTVVNPRESSSNQRCRRALPGR